MDLDYAFLCCFFPAPVRNYGRLDNDSPSFRRLLDANSDDSASNWHRFDYHFSQGPIAQGVGCQIPNLCWLKIFSCTPASRKTPLLVQHHPVLPSGRPRLQGVQRQIQECLPGRLLQARYATCRWPQLKELLWVLRRPSTVQFWYFLRGHNLMEVNFNSF